MNELTQDMFGVLVIGMVVFLGNPQGKLVTVARIHCQRKNAKTEFANFCELNTGKRFHAEFRFDSDYIG